MSGTDGFRGGSGLLRELTRNPLQSTLEWRRTPSPAAPALGRSNMAKNSWSATEADLESRIDEALRRAFPWLPRGAFSHQKRFRLQVGRAGVTVDGEVASRVDARADVIVSHEDRPLAVFELKRPGEKLTREDEQQGLSYAALHHPHPPLVVVTNGSDVKVLDSYSGEEWKPEGAPEQRLAALFANASRAAALDLSRAVEVLLGSRSEVWVGAVRAATRLTLDELSGDWRDSLRPFARDFLIPRAATDRVLAAFRGSRRLVVVEGAPLAGKSSVLRDVAERTAAGDEFGTLLVDAGRGGAGIFRSLAEILADTLGWPASPEEARQWLRQLSHRTGDGRGPTLLLAVDGVGPEDTAAVEAEITEITSGAYGSGVRLLLAVDDTLADRLVRSGRQESRIGRRAVRVPLQELNEDEFCAAAERLWQRQMGILEGGLYSDDLRVPWVLRALAARYAGDRALEAGQLAAVLPPLLGLELIELARERLQDAPHLRMRLRDVARAVLVDSEDRQRPVSLLLASVATFVVRRETLRAHVSDAGVDELVRDGVMKLTFGTEGEPLYVVRLPEMVAASAAALLAEELKERIDDEDAAADWLVSRAKAIPMGDVIAAQAILDYALGAGSLSSALIQHLAACAPRADPLRPGGRYAMQVGPFAAAEMEMGSDGSLLDSRTGGQRVRVPPELMAEEGGRVYSDFHPWLILSHLAGLPLAVVEEDEPGSVPEGAPTTRYDPGILLVVGTCPLVLRPPSRRTPIGMPTHELPGGVTVVCHAAGITEPITFSIYKFLASTGPAADSWIDDVGASASIPLLMRVLIALRALQHDTRTDVSGWAAATLASAILPRLEASRLIH